MADETKILDVISNALFAARIKYPNIAPGVTWDNSYNSDPLVNQHLAKVIMKELKDAGYVIEKNSSDSK